MPSYTQGQAVSQPLADFAPDVPNTSPGILLEMENFVPTVAGFMARNAPEIREATVFPQSDTPVGVYGMHLLEYPTAAFPAIGSPLYGSVVFAGTSHRIYSQNDVGGAGWVDRTGNVGQVHSKWRFAQFGSDLIAVAGTGPLVANPATTAAFVALGGSPPAAATLVTTVAGTVFMAAGSDWFNSAIGTDNNWTPNIQTQAATGTLTDYPGDITALAPLFRTIVVFKDRAIWVATLVGGAFTWDFQLISDQTGTPCQEAVIVLPDSIAFFGYDDFYITAGSAPQRIPNNLKEWFFATANPDFFPWMSSWYDYNNGIIYWHFGSNDVVITAAGAGLPYQWAPKDLYISYNVRSKRWGKGRLNAAGVCPVTTLHFNAGFFIDFDYSTPTTPGGIPVPQHLKSWTGEPGASSMTTGLFGSPSKLSQLMRVRPDYNAYPSAELIVPSHVNVNGKDPMVQTQSVLAADGWHYLRQYDRYHQLQLQTVGACEVTGMSAELREGGVR